MDSPHLQSATPLHSLHRVRTNSSTLSAHSLDSRGAIRKRSPSRPRPVSQQFPLDKPDLDRAPSTALASQWITPQHSPQHRPFPEPTATELFPRWTVPTPPRSDSGVPAVSLDANDEPVNPGIASTQTFAFENPTASAEMSSLGFLLPSQYGSGALESEPNSYSMDQSYPPHMRMSQPPASSGASAYAQTISSSPALYQSRTMPASTSSNRRHSELPSNVNADPSFNQNYRRISNPYDSMSTAEYTMAPSQTIPSISGINHSPMSSPPMGATSGPGLMPQYNNNNMSRSPNLYDSNIYSQNYTTAPSATQLYSSSASLSYPPPFVGSSVNEVLAKPLGSDSSIRVLNQRPKPQCWEHGCNGRQFSTFSNLLRHQREKSGTAAKSYCPKCGAEFTRTTARNGHLAHDKCQKQRRQSEEQ